MIWKLLFIYVLQIAVQQLMLGSNFLILLDLA